MAHFYGKAEGNASEATRCGTKDSGMVTYCAGWGGAIRTFTWHNADADVDMVRVEKVQWRGIGERRILYEGPIGHVEGRPEVFGCREEDEKYDSLATSTSRIS